MQLKWDIKTSPATGNSNEKGTGSVFYDDRLYGCDIFFVCVANQFMSPQLFSKPTLSNQLDIFPIEAYNGDTLIIQTCELA